VLLQQAKTLLEQGKTVDEVAVALNSSGLAKLFEQSKGASNVTRDLYNSIDAALLETQANKLAQAQRNVNALTQQNIPVATASPTAPRRAIKQALAGEAAKLETTKSALTGRLTAQQQAEEAALQGRQTAMTGQLTAQQQAEAAQIRKELIALESQAPARTIKPAADAQATSAKPDEPKVDARLPDTAVAKNVPATTSRPATTGASDQGIAAGLPRPPEFPSAVATTEKLLGDYFKRSADTEKQLAIDLSKNRLQGKAFEGYEQTLKKEAEQAGLDKDQAKYMAMFKAGLAMMAGTSRHPLENIGKGAMAGAVDYQEAYKELRKAERERTKEFALIEQARRAEEKGEIDLSRQLLIRAADARNRNDQFGVNALMQATGLDTDRLLGIWKTRYSGETQLKIADKRTAALMARGAGRGALTPYQMAQLRKEALKNVDEKQIRESLGKSKKLSKTPKAGEDANFDKQVSEAYQKKLNEYMNQLIGISENNPFTGFSMAGMED